MGGIGGIDRIDGRLKVNLLGARWYNYPNRTESICRSRHDDTMSEARTVGIVYIVDERKLYIGTQKAAWKAKHMARDPYVSSTIPLAKRIPFLPWIKIPARRLPLPGLPASLKIMQSTLRYAKHAIAMG